MKLRKLVVLVPIAGIIAGLGMGAAAFASGAFGGFAPGSVASPSPSPEAQQPTASPATFDEVILGVGDPDWAHLSPEEIVREKKRQADEDAGEPTPHETANPAPAPDPEPASDPEPKPKPKLKPEAFKPWKKVVKVWKADSSAFCAGLNDLRAGAGKPALASCTEGSGPLSWSKTMATKRVFKHDPSYSGSEVVGYSWKLQRMLTGPNGFVNSAAHMKVIAKGDGSTTAKVGCYWQRLKEQKAEDGPVSTFEYIYCTGRFSY